MLRVGEYILSTPLHESALHEIHRGFRASDGQPVVAKLTRGEYPPSFLLTRLRHEHLVLSTLGGVGVVACLGLEKFGNGLALLLEDLGDQTLESTSGAEHETRHLLKVALGAARALVRVHELGVLHKSISPHHFFVDPTDPTRVKLIDFGIATHLSHERQAVASSVEFGDALHFVAPEQTGRMNRAVDRRSDLYSFGATLYYLFTGCPPFQTQDPLELLHCHLTRVPKAPRELVPTLPVAISQLILKLLNKVSEDRYQTGNGLVHDLKAILEQLELTGRVSDVPLGSRDFTGELSIPQRLYGREAETSTMTSTLDRVHRGTPEVLLVSGQSGIGKSALIRELHQFVDRNDLFVTGKFEYLRQSIPYTAISQTCKEITQLTLAERADVLAATRKRIEAALGPNGKVMTDFLPEIEWLIGPQPPVPELGPIETQSRFELVFEQFLGALTTDGRSLILYLDDLQWADAASLRLLEVALSGVACTNLLVIGGYRSGEVNASHPLTLFRAELAKKAVRVSEIALGPLTRRHVSALLADAFGTDASQTMTLAAALVDKTGGNPFFLGQLLTSLFNEHVVWFDAEASEWQWDLPRVEASLVTENVVGFMLERLRRLPQPSQEVLRLAACVGHEFDLQTLTEVAGWSLSQLATPLWRALEDGLLVPLDGNYRFAELSGSSEQADLPNAKYRFLHDRVTEAAYSLLDDSQRQRAHLKIGKFLQSRHGDDANALFEILDQLNRGSELISSPEERHHLAQMNLAAGQRARSGAAAEAAVNYLQRVETVLIPTDWENDYQLLFPSYLLRAECEQLLGHGDRSLEVLDEAERRARTTLDRAQARNIRAVLLTHLSRLRDAAQTCVQTMELLGDSVPALEDLPALRSAIEAEFAAYQIERGPRSISSLAELPVMTDPVQLALMDTYANTIPAAFQSIREVMVLVVLKAARLSLRYGSAPITPFMYTQYGLVHSIITGDHETAYRFGELGIEMARRAGNPALQMQPLFVFGAFLSHWRRPLAQSLDLMQLALRIGMDTGDSAHTPYCAGFLANYRFYAGESLEQIAAGLPAAFALVGRTDDVLNRGFLVALRQAIAALRGETASIGCLDSGDFSEDEFESSAAPPVLAYLGAAKAFVKLVAGDAQAALRATEMMHPLPNIFYNAEHRTLRALARARMASDAVPAERGALLDQVREDAAVLATWAQVCPANHAHRSELIAAELAAIERRDLDAFGAYDRAIDLARENGFVQYQALACECCAQFQLRLGNRRIARAYLREALYAYDRWGAVGKANALLEEHSDLFEGARNKRLSDRTAAGSQSSPPGGHLDLATVIRATESIGAELSFDRVVERLMRTVSESAGAQRGYLLLDVSGGLRLVAAISGAEVHLGLSEDLTSTEQLPFGVVQYVSNTHTALLLDDAATDPRFRSDSYVIHQRPKSVLCTPLLRQGRVTGVLYLENNSTTHGFSPANLELTQFLAAQTTTAVDNARLYQQLATVTDQLKNTNERLELQVAERTKELQSTLSAVWAEMDLARKIQTVLLPSNQRARDYDIAATMMPADRVGGDYYDIIPSRDRLWLVIGDVSGHGVTAGLVMMMIQTAIRALITGTSGLGSRTPADVLVRTNEALRSNLDRVGKGQYMTVTLLELNGPRVSFAGLHQDLLLYRAKTGLVERVETHGVWIGVLEDISGLVENETLKLEVGDTLLLYSDGITELRVQNQLLGTAELARRFHVIAKEGHSPNAIIRHLLDSVSSSERSDDISLVALRYCPHAQTHVTESPSKCTVETEHRNTVMKNVVIEAEIQPVWATVREIRCRLNGELASYSDRLRYASGMVASELLENAIKYGEPLPALSQISFSFVIQDGLCRITVTNGSQSHENISRLKAMIAEVNAAEDKSALYMRRMQELLEHPSDRTGLGIYRIGFEGGFDLACEASDGIVTVVATRSLQ